MASEVFTHDMLIKLFLNKFGADLLFVESEDSVYLYKDGWYRPLSLRDLTRMLLLFLDDLKLPSDTNPDPTPFLPKNFNITSGLVASLIEGLKPRIPRRVDRPDSTIVTFTDGQALDMTDFTYHPWSRARLSFYSLNCASADTKADCPNFKQFLSEVLVTSTDRTTPDPSLIDFVQQMLGYFLLPTLKAEAAFFFVGTTAANGKSVLMHVIRDLIGYDFVSSLSLSDLTKNRFAIPDLIGKKLNIRGEEEEKFLSGALFKELISGDLVSGDVKYGGRVTFVNKAKFLFATNDVPTFKQLDAGVLRRLFFIPFHRSFTADPTAKPKDELIASMLAERAGIIGYALEGAHNLIAANLQFRRPPAMLAMNAEFETASSSAIAFFSECYDVTANPEDVCHVDGMYNRYRDWCQNNGHNSQSKNRFGKELNDRYGRDGLLSARTYDKDMAKNVRVRTGLKEKPDAFWLNQSAETKPSF